MLRSLRWSFLAVAAGLTSVPLRSAAPRCRLPSLSASPALSSLLSSHAEEITALRSSEAGASLNEVECLRIAMAHAGDASAAVDALEQITAWREGEGRSICQSASAAVEQAMAGGGWDNAPVFSAAPYSDKIGKYITPSNCLTLPLSSGDLCYIIRAGSIDDGSLMAEVNEQQVVEFFLFAKEVNRLVADMRSAATGQLVTIVTANDLSGVDLFGDATFRKALSASSKKADVVFLSLNGPTLLLNLPFLANALVKLFTPLFPPKVRAKLKFEKGPLSDVDDLTKLHNPNGQERQQFVTDIQSILDK